MRFAIPAGVLACFVGAVALALLSSLSLSVIGAALLVVLVTIDSLVHRPRQPAGAEPTTVTVDLSRRRP